ncbi:hypothetical protein [Nonomuraea sp. NPDC002799]
MTITLMITAPARSYEPERLRLFTWPHGSCAADADCACASPPDGPMKSSPPSSASPARTNLALEEGFKFVLRTILIRSTNCNSFPVSDDLVP